jgi:hypothetical protein
MSLIRNSRLTHCLLPFVLMFAGCVPVEQLPPGLVPSAPNSGSNSSGFADPEPGSLSVTSTHFTIKGYSQTDLDALKQAAEDLYNKIGNDTGLYTFLASGNYTLVEYQDQNEYQKKTHQPNWSHAIASGKGVYFYSDPNLMPELAHQMVHMIFDSYLGDKANGNKWLEEGLAMNEELIKMTDSDRSSYSTLKANQLRQSRMPFSQMTFFVTNSEEKRRTDEWYQQVESVVTYMLSQGSALAFAQFLGELKNGSDIDRALSDSYSAKFRSLNDLEAAWKYTI